jgi:hypothetical protein
VRLHKNEQFHDDEFCCPALHDSTCEQSVGALEEAKRRWPGIVVLTKRRLDDELGVAVYFTFPGGKYMAVWMSGTNEIGVVSEDRPCWQHFISTHGVTAATSMDFRN